jgi:hypothetical protein
LCSRLLLDSTTSSCSPSASSRLFALPELLTINGGEKVRMLAALR